MVAGALVGMGLMQFIVSCTLSMLLRHTKRYAVLGSFDQTWFSCSGQHQLISFFSFLCPCSGCILLSCLPFVGAVQLEAITRRQRTILCDCGRMGCLQWHLGNTFIRIDHTNTSEPYDGGRITVAGMPFPWLGHNIRRSRLSLRKSKNIDSVHIAGDQRYTVCNAGDTLRGPTQNTIVQYVTT